MRLINSFKYAFRGLWIALRDQANMKIHLVAAFIIIITGLYLKFNYTDWCIVSITIGVVIGMEAVNTSIEELVNIVSPEKRLEAGRIKDIAAGAVLITSIVALIVGILLVFSKLN